MIRAQLLRATSATVLALLIGSAGVAAQEAPGPAGSAVSAGPLSLPDGADESALAQRMALPSPPPAVVTLAPTVVSPAPDRDDITGTVGAGASNAAGAPEGAPPLAFDDAASAPPAVAATPAPAVSASPAPVAAAVPATPALPAPNGGSATPPAADAAIAPAPVADAPVAAAVPASPAGMGLTPGAFATLLAGFSADLPATEPPERRSQRDSIVAFYAAHGNVPLWVADGHLTPAARAVASRLAAAAEDGLDLSRYPVALPQDEDTAALGRAELALSEAALAYARQASGSRVNVGRIGALIDLRPDVADASRVLGSVPGAPDPGAALQAFNPPQPGYQALRAKLAEVRRAAGPVVADQARIPYGPVLKLGMRDDRVPLLRARFGLDIADESPDAPPLVYDTQVVTAVADFQRAHRLPASGVLTARTVAALSGGGMSRALEGDLLANMEMWRWMPREQAPERIEVNIPAFKVRVLRDNAVVHETRVVVGQPEKPTPVFAQQMRFIIVNPYWNVPLSIIKKEMMPKLAADPNYFANHGYEVVERNGTTFVRQPPGDGNALGRIKFMFPNSHAVYLHDTNARSYFAKDMRALSHGCVRVEDPFSFAEAVLKPENGWSEARIRKLIGGEERTINLPRPMPILITYFTAEADGSGEVQMRDDVYGYTGKVKAALGLGGEVRLSSARPARAAERATGVMR